MASFDRDGHVPLKELRPRPIEALGRIWTWKTPHGLFGTRLRPNRIEALGEESVSLPMSGRVWKHICDQSEKSHLRPLQCIHLGIEISVLDPIYMSREYCSEIEHLAKNNN